MKVGPIVSFGNFFKSKKSKSEIVREEKTEDFVADGGFVKRSALRKAENLTPEAVINKRFPPTKFREGYDQDEVDDFLDEVVVELRRLTNEEYALKLAKSKDTLPHSSPSSLTPEDVVNKRFGATTFRTGYDQDEVDDFLDEIVSALRRLTTTNAEARAAIVKTIEENSETS